MAWERMAFAGFETQSPSEYVTMRTAASHPLIQDTDSASGNYSLNVSQSAVVGFPLKAARARLRGGFFDKHSGCPASNFPAVLGLHGNDGPVIEVTYGQPTDHFELRVDNVVVDTTSAAGAGYALNTWLPIGVQANIANDASGFVSIYVNGTEVLSYSGAITRAVPGLFVVGRLLGVGHNYTIPRRIDCVYVDGTLDEEPNIAPPNPRFEYKVVTADGGTVQWTPVGATDNYDAVNDGAPDGGVTRVESDTHGQRDLYLFGGYVAPEGFAIDAVIPSYIAMKTAAGSTMQIAPVVKDGGSPTVFDSLDLPASYGHIWARLATRPGGGVWGSSIESGVEIGQDTVAP